MIYKGIIFDLDGTLMDTSEGIKKSIQATLEILGDKAIDEDLTKNFIGPPIYESFQKELGFSYDKALRATEEFRRIYKCKFLFEAEPYPKIFQLLDLLKEKGFKLGVATNKREDYALDLLRKFNFTNCFDCIKGSDIENKKKKKDIITECCYELKLIPSECLMIGDSLGDLKAAQECEMDFWAALYGFGFDKEKLEGNFPFGSSFFSVEEIIEVILK